MRGPAVFRSVLAAVAVSGASCISAIRGVGASPVSGDAPVRALSVRWVSESSGGDWDVLQAILGNGGTESRTIVAVEMDGTRVPDVLFGPRERSERSFLIDGKPPPRADSPDRGSVVAWARLQPGATILPGRSVSFFACFRERAAHAGPRVAVFRMDDGSVLSVALPDPSRPPERTAAIRYVAWAIDGSAVAVSLAGASSPVSLKIDGENVSGFAVLFPSNPDAPRVLCARLGNPVKTGDCRLIEIGCSDGSSATAFVKAFPWFSVDALRPGGGPLDPPPLSAAAGACSPDSVRAVLRADSDPVCQDAKAGVPGFSVRDCSDGLRRIAADCQARFAGIDFCRARTPTAWSLYPLFGEAVFVKPYLPPDRSPAPERTGDRLEIVSRMVRAAFPNPVVLVPDRFPGTGSLDAPSLEALVFASAARGVKGVQWRYWLNGGPDPFAGLPGVAETVRGTTSALVRFRPVLCAAVPVAVTVSRRDRLEVSEAWTGDAGAMFVLRDLRNPGDRGPSDSSASCCGGDGTEPEMFGAALPEWLAPGRIFDLASGDEIPVTDSGTVLSLPKPSKGRTRSFWVSNRKASVFPGCEGCGTPATIPKTGFMQ